MQHDQILNSFENWSRVIGGILRSAGIGGFLENRNQLKEIALSDNDEDIMPLLDMWWEQFGDKPSVVKINKEIPSLSALVEEFEIQLPIKQRRIGESLVYDARPFGQMLKHNRGRVFVLTNGEEVRLEQEETRSRHGMMWSLRSVHSDA